MQEQLQSMRRWIATSSKGLTEGKHEAVSGTRFGTTRLVGCDKSRDSCNHFMAKETNDDVND